LGCRKHPAPRVCALGILELFPSAFAVILAARTRMMLLNAAAGMLSFRLMRVESLDASEKFASGKKTVAGDLNPNPFCTQILLPNHLKPKTLCFHSHIRNNQATWLEARRR
jgi:hypothetical protein